MVNIISDYIPPFSPLPNIAPFTYKDGQTYLSTLDNLRVYVNKTLVEFVNTNYQVLGLEFATEVNTLIRFVNGAIDNKDAFVTATLAAQTTANNTAIQVLTDYVNAQVASIINSNISVVDPMVKTIVNNTASVARIALDLLYPSKANFTNVNNTSDANKPVSTATALSISNEVTRATNAEATKASLDATGYIGSPAIVQASRTSTAESDVRPLVIPQPIVKRSVLDVDIIAAKRRNLMEYTEDTSNARYNATGTKTPTDTIIRQNPVTGASMTLARFDFSNYYHNVSTNWTGNGMAPFVVGSRYIMSHYVVSANPDDRVFWMRQPTVNNGWGKRFIQPNILTRVWQLVQASSTITLNAIGDPLVGYNNSSVDGVATWIYNGSQPNDAPSAVYAGGFQLELTDSTALDGIAGIGDSTMQGSSGSNDNTQAREWMGLLEGMLNCNTFNRGIGGNTLVTMNNRWATDITPLKISCKYVIIQGGINDISNGATLATCQTAIISMVAKAKTDGFIPVLLTCTPSQSMAANDAFEAVRLAFNSWLKVTYGNVIDIATVISDPFNPKYIKRTPGGNTGWYGDGVHYTYNAKRAVAEKIASWKGWDLPTPSTYQKIVATTYTPAGGFVVSSPDGTQYRITVANGGAMTAVAI